MLGTHSRESSQERRPRKCMEHIFQRKLEGSPSDGPGTNCTFVGIAETISKHMYRPDFHRTRAICGLIVYIGIIVMRTAVSTYRIRNGITR